ncbi:hypothetical protein O6H91_08G086900 [Diphasiastrum complanatum]|uniref:Uncharacterized protein n=1 Tax=Diphasiastrum complanatum TaxID=34168 RepID=A0ACC2D0L5_DIPCM|nr:hypothetical protein O6H91_08G086900 [Diphasiastrum complanatum]
MPWQCSTVRVSNLSLKATEQDLQEFFSFSGEIDHIELDREEFFQVAHVTFKDPDALDTALLLSGATIVDQPVNIVPVESHDVLDQFQEHNFSQSKVIDITPKKENKAQAVITDMLANGYVLSKDAMGKAKAFDEKHRLSATASSKVSAVDKKIRLSHTINAGTAAVANGMKAMNEKLQVTSRTKSAFSTVGQTANSAGSTLMKNKYIHTSAGWFSGAYKKVAKAANNVSEKTKEKVQKKEEQRREHRLA